MSSIDRLKWYLLCAVLFVMSSMLATAQHKYDPLVEAEIRRLLEADTQAFLRADVESLTKLYADDFVVTNPFNKFLNAMRC